MPGNNPVKRTLFEQERACRPANNQSGVPYGTTTLTWWGTSDRCWPRGFRTGLKCAGRLVSQAIQRPLKAIGV